MTIAPFNNKVFFIILKIIVVLSTYGYISCKLYNSKEIPGFVYESITFSNKNHFNNYHSYFNDNKLVT